MDIFKATDGRNWYISVDGGESFELCQREPVLGNKLFTPLDAIPVNDATSAQEAEVTLSREQLEARGFIISRVD